MRKTQHSPRHYEWMDSLETYTPLLGEIEDRIKYNLRVTAALRTTGGGNTSAERKAKIYQELADGAAAVRDARLYALCVLGLDFVSSSQLGVDIKRGKGHTTRRLAKLRSYSRAIRLARSYLRNITLDVARDYESRGQALFAALATEDLTS